MVKDLLKTSEVSKTSEVWSVRFNMLLTNTHIEGDSV